MFIYARERAPQQLTLVSCMNATCRRPLFKTNAKNLTVSNTEGFPVKDIPVGSNYIQHQCHSCKWTYNILFG